MSVRLSVAACPHYCTDPDVTWRNGRGALSCALLGGFAIGAGFRYYDHIAKSVHGFCCNDNIAANAECQRVLVLALCLLCDKVVAMRPRVMGITLYVTVVTVSPLLKV